MDGLSSTSVFARALAASRRTDEAAAMFRKVEQHAVDSGQYRLASAVAGDLTNLLREAGHLEEALTTAERMKDHTRKAGLGQWTQLGDEVRRLQILNAIGRHEEALTALKTWRDEMRSWPELSDEDDAAQPWHVKDVLLHTGYASALDLERWQEALSLNEEAVQARVSRGATALEVAQTQYNNYGPLLKRQRPDQARSVLHQCLTVFESAGGNEDLGRIHSALAHVEHEVQHFPQAVRHECMALRFRYLSRLPNGCAVSHFNLATYLTRTSEDALVALAHRLAGVLIYYQTYDGKLPGRLDTLRRHLASVTPADPPANFDELCRLVEQTDGVRFRDLFSRLPQRAASGDEALRTVLKMARA